MIEAWLLIPMITVGEGLVVTLGAAAAETDRHGWPETVLVISNAATTTRRASSPTKALAIGVRIHHEQEQVVERPTDEISAETTTMIAMITTTDMIMATSMTTIGTRAGTMDGMIGMDTTRAIASPTSLISMRDGERSQGSSKQQELGKLVGGTGTTAKSGAEKRIEAKPTEDPSRVGQSRSGGDGSSLRITMKIRVKSTDGGPLLRLNRRFYQAKPQQAMTRIRVRRRKMMMISVKATGTMTPTVTSSGGTTKNTRRTIRRIMKRITRMVVAPHPALAGLATTRSRGRTMRLVHRLIRSRVPVQS